MEVCIVMVAVLFPRVVGLNLRPNDVLLPGARFVIRGWVMVKSVVLFTRMFPSMMMFFVLLFSIINVISWLDV